MISPYSKSDECSRCGNIGETWYHICRQCNGKAQEDYKKDCEMMNYR